MYIKYEWFYWELVTRRRIRFYISQSRSHQLLTTLRMRLNAISPDTDEFVYDNVLDDDGNPVMLKKYDLKYIIISVDKYSIYNDVGCSELYKEFFKILPIIQLWEMRIKWRLLDAHTIVDN